MKLNGQPITRAKYLVSIQYCGRITTCSWCGQVNTTKKGQKYLYQYTLDDDWRTPSLITGLFCSIECLRCYHS